MVSQDKRIEWQTPHLSSLESAGFCVQLSAILRHLGKTSKKNWFPRSVKSELRRIKSSFSEPSS